jgi:DNA-binding beta-propeller fold protein YncE
VIDTTTNPNTVVATVGVGVFPVGVAISPDGTRAYVTNAGDFTVSVIDTTTTPPRP